ncbi:MAG TPA: diaminopimelate decarboxylase [Gammaproteobacteria bacterium]|nr:MAG: diaminopimelate decarboxylase [Candidatus Endolissoclinum sp. TMED55]PDH34734.1 MAG: diaminopimelate decarboxylase [Candidatus Thioglobus sp. MED-G23]HBP85686.1 diaminopimelate decarboxylase [Gammaproteobacteria bacterium]HCL94057.1 diaminopimelate decarboxylase [Gammaproteobacteria bacterium]
MDHFGYRQDRLYAEEVPLSAIAERVGTPCYVYSHATLERHYRVFDEAFGDWPHHICFAVKANGNLAVLQVLERLGAGFDIVSGGELARVLAAGGRASNVVFSGVGKSSDEIAKALTAGVRILSIESGEELERVNAVALSLGHKAPIGIRINPDVDPNTHPYIATGLRENKFGVPAADAPELYRKASAMAGIEVVGIGCHIGSQLTEIAPFCDAVERVLDVVDTLAQDDIRLSHLDLGGGVGIRYSDETPPDPKDYVQAILAILKRRNCDLAVTLEPGRAIAGNAGVLLSSVEYIKSGPEKDFVIVDAAMNDLLRPALYQAWHEVVRADRGPDRKMLTCDVVGPVCETGDFIARDRQLAVAPGDLVVVRSVGAYGFVMASNYNTRPRPAEVMVDGDQLYVVREREQTADLFSAETLLP